MLLGSKGGTSISYLHQGRVFPFGPEGGLVHRPEQGVVSDLDRNFFICAVCIGIGGV